MTQIHPTLLLLLVEAVGVLALVLGVILVTAWLRRQREHHAVRSLIATVAETAPARAQSNSDAIAAALGIESDALAQRAKQVENAQRALLQSVVLAWARRDTGAIATLLEPLEALVACWRTLLHEGGGKQSQSSAQDEALTPRIKELELEKAMIAEELQITRDTMDRMLNEYAAMYQRGDTDDDSTARRVLSGRGGANNASGAAVQTAATREADVEMDAEASDEALPGGNEHLPATDSEAASVEDSVSDDGEDLQRMQDDLETLFDQPASDDAEEPQSGVDDDPFPVVDDEDERFEEVSGNDADQRAAAETAAATQA